MKQAKKPLGEWSTQDELNFVAELQACNSKAFEHYRSTFLKRTRWGKVDKSKIAHFLGLKGGNNEPAKEKK